MLQEVDLITFYDPKSSPESYFAEHSYTETCFISKLDTKYEFARKLPISRKKVIYKKYWKVLLVSNLSDKCDYKIIFICKSPKWNRNNYTGIINILLNISISRTRTTLAISFILNSYFEFYEVSQTVTENVMINYVHEYVSTCVRIGN